MEKVVSKKIQCPHCEMFYTSGHYNRHVNSCIKNPLNIKTCPVCHKKFCTKEKNNKTCSYSCANTYFRSGPNNPNWREDRYQSTCFAYHKKQCVVCKEKNIVEVHHLDENKTNNKPENLIPLCPTHHQYWHSRYKHLIEKYVYDYIENWIKNMKQMQSIKLGVS